MSAPRAEHRPVIRHHHDDTFHDPWEWLRDVDDPEVLEHLKAETAWAVQHIADQEPLRQALFDEISARTQQTDLSVASWVTHRDGDDTSHWWYYTRTVEGSEHPIYCRVPATDRDQLPDLTSGSVQGEQILVDGNAEAQGHDFFSIGDCEVSSDGRWLAWSADIRGDERYLLRFRDLTGDTSNDEVVSDIMPGVVWGGNDSVFYTRSDASWRPYQVRRHDLGTSPDHDPVVVEEQDDRFWLSVESSADRNWVLIGSASKMTSEWSFLPADEPASEPRLVAPRRTGIEYEVDMAGDRLFIVHNDDATDFAVAEADLATPDQWTTLIPAEPGCRITGIGLHRDHLIVSLRRDGLSAIEVIDRTALGALDMDTRRLVAVDEELYTVDAVGEPDYNSDRFRFVLSSLVTPPQVVEQIVATGHQRVLKQTPVLDHPEQGPYRATDYIQERLWVTVTDGTEVPVSIVRRRDTPVDGTAPLIVYGYGAYEASSEPQFAIWRLSLLDRGVVWAIAHVRGGGEMGRSWYEQGRLEHKPNTFTDFVDCTRELIRRGYGSPDRVGAFGGSAGGLLMGAVANLAPELYTAIGASVPFVDPLTSILMPDLPLTATEWEEWGNPITDPEIYAVMKSYAPYENVRPVHYPAILATTSLHDTRVLVVEPAKWVARLRETTLNSDEDILLHVEMSGGHGGPSGRYQLWRTLCREFAWMLTQLGATEVMPRPTNKP